MSAETQDRANQLYDELLAVRDEMMEFAGALELDGSYHAGSGMREMVVQIDKVLDDYDKWLALDMRPLG